MNREQLFREIGDIDEKYVEEAYVDDKSVHVLNKMKNKKTASTWLRWGSLVACICILITVVIAGGNYFLTQGLTGIGGMDSEAPMEGAMEESCTEESATVESAMEETEEEVEDESEEWGIIYNSTQIREYNYDETHRILADNGIEVQVQTVNVDAIPETLQLSKDATIIEGISVEGAYREELEGRYTYCAVFTMDGTCYSVSATGEDTSVMEEANYQVVVDIISGKLKADDMERVE